jgi:hypothetical protein
MAAASTTTHLQRLLSMVDKRQERICKTCGRPFQRSVSHNGTVENLIRFKQRDYCSRACSALARERAKPKRNPQVFSGQANFFR